jgi:hypothetical protein
MNIPQRFVHIPIHPLNPCARDAEVRAFYEGNWSQERVFRDLFGGIAKARRCHAALGRAGAWRRLRRAPRYAASARWSKTPRLVVDAADDFSARHLRFVSSKDRAVTLTWSATPTPVHLIGGVPALAAISPDGRACPKRRSVSRLLVYVRGANGTGRGCNDLPASSYRLKV